MISSLLHPNTKTFFEPEEGKDEEVAVDDVERERKKIK
jgi:hypothetical protein